MVQPEPAYRDDRQAVMARFDGTWEAARGRLQELAERQRAGEPIDTPVGVAETMVHLARWDELVTEIVRTRAAGGPPPDVADEPDGVLNARWLAEDLYADRDDAERRMDRAHAAYRGALESLPEDAWDAFGEGSAVRNTEHYRSHLDAPLELPIDRDESLRILDEAREALRTRLIGLVAGDEAPGGTGDVTLGEAITHVAHWDESGVEVLRRWQREPEAEEPYASRDREWNARWLEEDRGADPNAALGRFERASAELRAVLADLDDELWRRRGVPYAIGSAVHYRSHTRDPLEFPR